MTQGIVSVLKDGSVILKCVAGCNGYNAAALAKRLKAERVETHTEAYHIARELDFGCADCLVVLGSDLIRRANEDTLRSAYRDTFGDPEWNPRWDIGTADHTVVVDISGDAP